MLLADLWKSNIKHGLTFVDYLPRSTSTAYMDRTPLAPNMALNRNTRHVARAR